MYFIQETDKPNMLSQLLLIPKLEKDKIIIPMIWGRRKNHHHR